MHGLYCALHGFIVDVGDGYTTQLHVHDIAFFEVNDLVSGASQRHCIRRQKVFSIACANDQRTAEASADDMAGFVMAEHGDGKGAVQALDGCLHGAQQIAVIHMVNQVRDHLGISLRDKHITLGDQFAAYVFVVLDNAVVNNSNPVDAIFSREVRVCVVGGRYAMRCPARVRNADMAGQAGVGDLRFQFGDARNAARTLQAVLMHGHAARIIAAIFQTLQAFEQDGNNITLRYCADDAAHVSPIFSV